MTRGRRVRRPLVAWHGGIGVPHGGVGVPAASDAGPGPATQISSGIYNLMWDLAKSDIGE